MNVWRSVSKLAWEEDTCLLLETDLEIQPENAFQRYLES